MWVFDSSNEASGCTGYRAKKKPTLKTVPWLRNQENPRKMVILIVGGFFLIFFATVHCKELRFFLRCNQHIQMFHLSNQTPPYDDFHFAECKI